MSKTIPKVSIQLKSKVYGLFRNLVNTLSNTLGEYVDNAVQSYLNNKDRLRSYEPNYKLEIRIIMDWEKKTLSIIDNAAGIDEKNYERAFEPANIPTDANGLNEFGVGMKTASIWLADNWTVTTKALGEDVERVTSFDLEKVMREEKEDLNVISNPKPLEEHYTKIVLTNLSQNAPKTNALETVKKHLASIYRSYLRTDEIIIYINGTKLEAPNYAILDAPYYKTPDATPILWKKEIHYNDGIHKADGFIGILEKIQLGANGLVLMRRGRVIVGGEGEHFFPTCLSGSPGTFKYKRIFGELELDGFEVSFNKNSFKGEDEILAIMQKIRDDLAKQEPSIFVQADKYRKQDKDQINKIAAELQKKFEEKHPDDEEIKERIREENKIISNIDSIKENENLINESKSEHTYSTTFMYQDKPCKLKSELITDTESSLLYSITKDGDDYICKINLNHIFFSHYPKLKNGNDYEPIIRIITAFAKAEIQAPSRGTTNPHNLRVLFNQYILGED